MRSYYQHAKKPLDPPVAPEVKQEAAPIKQKSRGAAWMSGGQKLVEIRSHWEAKVEEVAPVPRDVVAVARESLCRFHPCQHASCAVRVIYDDDRERTPQDDCGICALARTGFIERPFARGKLEIHTADDRPFFGQYTIVSFYCVQGKLHAETCSCENVAKAPGACANARAKAGQSPRRAACCQRFYACAHDVIAGNDARENGLHCCWNMHLSDTYPIYTCMVALELVSGVRFDCPIPILDEDCAWLDVVSAIAYNASARLVVACAHDDAIIIARELLTAHLPKCIGPDAFFLCVLANSQVRRILPIRRLGECRSAPSGIAQNFMELAQIITAVAGYHGSLALIPSREQSGARLEQITERVRSGRLLRKDDTGVPGRVTRHRDSDEKIYSDAMAFPRALCARARTETLARDDLAY